MEPATNLPYDNLGDALTVLAASQPSAPVLHVRGRSSLTRGDLAAQIRYVRERLGSWGIAPGDVVAAVIPTRPEMAVACATLPSSCTLAPLGPALTVDAYARLLVRTHATAVLAPSGLDNPIRAAAQRHGVAEIDVLPQPDAPAGLFALDLCRAGRSLRAARAARPELAYILVSAGTTGQPKLVPSTHRQTLLYAKVAAEWLDYSHNDVGCHLTPIHLGAGLRSGLMNPLLAGLPIVCLPESNVDAFFRAIEEFHLTCLNAGFTLHRAILRRVSEYREALRQSHFRFLRAGNGRLHTEEIDRLEQAFEAPVLVALSSVEATISHDPLPPRRRKPGAAGLPLVNEVAAMDGTGRISAANPAGELVVRGPLVFPGYLDDPELNAASFVGDWFRTGDLGYLDDEGYVHISGRIKEIINRGGEKVSPVEVDAAIESLPGVAEAATFAISHPTLGDEIVAALIKHADSQIDEVQVIEHVRQRLGPVKVPRKIFFVDRIPRTGNGKVRRLELPRMLGLDQGTSAQADATPASVTPVSLSPLEAVLAGLWASLLKLTTVGRDDNFFLLGGDSLHAVQLIVQIKTLFGAELPIQSVYKEAATVAGMASAIAALRTGSIAAPGAHSPLIALNAQGSLPPVHGVPGRHGNAAVFAALSHALGPDQPFYALQSVGLEGTRAPLHTIEHMAKAYVSEIRTVQPHGPYVLLGFCFGATVAYEMTRQLLAAGEEVALLGLLDPPRRKPNKSTGNTPSPPRAARRAVALGSLAVSRLKLYVNEMRPIGYTERLRFIARKLRALAALLAQREKLEGIQPELTAIEVYRTNLLAGRRYQRTPLKGRLRALDVFETNRPGQQPFDLRGFWDGGINRHLVPGTDPGDMMLGQNVRVFAALLTERLRATCSELACTLTPSAESIPAQRKVARPSHDR